MRTKWFLNRHIAIVFAQEHLRKKVTIEQKSITPCATKPHDLPEKYLSTLRVYTMEASDPEKEQKEGFHSGGVPCATKKTLSTR